MLFALGYVCYCASLFFSLRHLVEAEPKKTETCANSSGLLIGLAKALELASVAFVSLVCASKGMNSHRTQKKHGHFFEILSTHACPAGNKITSKQYFRD